MISTHPCSDLSAIRDLKAEYLQSLIAPMDGMWDSGFVNASPHWEMRVNGERVGYYVANAEGTLLQFHVQPALEEHRQTLFDHVIAQESVQQAEASTVDPSFLSLCLDVHTKAVVHTYLYEVRADACPDPQKIAGVALRVITAGELDRTVALQENCLGYTAEHKNDSNWLRGYSQNLIARTELYALCRNDEWLGLGECRRSDSQKGVTDLGMMIAPQHRSKGLGAYVLTCLRVHAAGQGRRAICSTTIENGAARKAIVRSGFMSRHRIMTINW
jgi:GNAT superfamily N-acetyltransferase